MCPHVGWHTCQNVHMIDRSQSWVCLSVLLLILFFWYWISWRIWTRLLQLDVSGIYLSTLHPYAVQGLLPNPAFDLDTQGISSDLHACTAVNLTQQGISLAFILFINTYFFQYIPNVNNRSWSTSEEKWTSKLDVHFTLLELYTSQVNVYI